MDKDLVLVKLDTARFALAEAKTIQDTKKVYDAAQATLIFAKRQKAGKEIELQVTAFMVDALKQLGEMLKETPRAKGGQPYQKSTPTDLVGVETLAELGLDYKTSKLAQDVANLPEEQLEKVKLSILSISKARTETKRNINIANLESIEAQEAKAIQGVYDVIVIDPPWDMQKIERDVAPNQVAFDYPTMTIDEIAQIEIPYADNCHVWLWTTQKFLPHAFGLFAAWDVKYVCTFNWHKAGGFQVVGLPQYNNEFVLYGRVGSPSFIDTKDFKTSFEGKRTGHSAKPEEFYNTVRRVTAGRRLDMFNRRKIDGFDGWGKESK